MAHIIFEGLVAVENGQLYCKFIGDPKDDKPVIVVLPGGPGLGYELYEGHSAVFASTARMLFFDPRGTDQSTQALQVADYTLDNYIKDAKALIDHFHLTKVIILGTSYGSMAAVNFAITYPEVLHKLILVAGAPSHHFIECAQQELAVHGNAAQQVIGKILFAGEFKDDAELSEFFSIMAPLYSIKAKRDGVSKRTVKCARALLNHGFKTRFGLFDYRARLAEIKAPTLIMVGRQDWINPVSQAQIMADAIEYAALQVIDGAGHAVAVDQPAIYQCCVIDFIQA